MLPSLCYSAVIMLSGYYGFSHLHCTQNGLDFALAAIYILGFKVPGKLSFFFFFQSTDDCCFGCFICKVRSYGSPILVFSPLEHNVKFVWEYARLFYLKICFLIVHWQPHVHCTFYVPRFSGIFSFEEGGEHLMKLQREPHIWEKKKFQHLVVFEPAGQILLVRGCGHFPFHHLDLQSEAKIWKYKNEWTPQK